MSDKSLTEDEKQAKLKAEKIKIALQKLKKARVQKVRFLWWKPSISSIDQFLMAHDDRDLITKRVESIYC